MYADSKECCQRRVLPESIIPFCNALEEELEYIPSSTTKSQLKKLPNYWKVLQDLLKIKGSWKFQFDGTLLRVNNNPFESGVSSIGG